MSIPLDPLGPGSPFPLISLLHTDDWVDFWNIVWKSWIQSNSASGGGSAYPSLYSKNGRIVEVENDGLEAKKTETASLSILLPEGWTGVLDGVYIPPLEADVIIGGITPNFNGYIVPTYIYDENSETWVWDHTEHATRPALGAGVVAKITVLTDRVDTLVATEAETDLIISLPLLMARIRALMAALSGVGEDGEGTPTFIIENAIWSLADPRPAADVIQEMIDEKFATAIEAVNNGGERTGLTDVDQLWNFVLGLVRGQRETSPRTLRFVNSGSVRPGVYGTESAGDSEVFDRGGTLTEDTENRNYRSD